MNDNQLFGYKYPYHHEQKDKKFQNNLQNML